MLWMLATGVLFIVMNAFMKKLSHELDPWLVGFIRYFIGAAFILPATLRGGVRGIWPRQPGLQVLRGAFHAGGMMLWFAALPSVTLAELTAIGFSGPLYICIGAVLFLHERMTGARWAAVLVGFAGVVLVVHPFDGASFSAISAGMLLMLASSPVFAGSFLLAKALTRREGAGVMVLWQHALVALFLAPLALPHWSPPNAGQWGLLVFCGLLGAISHYCMMRAFSVADISAVQTVRFLELVWAAILGFVLFGTLPTGWTLAGGTVILAATFALARSESRGRAAR
jgi:drug/metabolite transporter (DMT)-like permease